MIFFFFFFNDTATTEIYTLSLHDALPIFAACKIRRTPADQQQPPLRVWVRSAHRGIRDRKSTRLNSSHLVISYAVFCLKKKKAVKHSRTARHFVSSTLPDALLHSYLYVLH